jgi:hypothetical protein
MPVIGSSASAYGAFSHGHQEHRIVSTDAEVHPLLQRHLLRRHDVVIADDVVTSTAAE